MIANQPNYWNLYSKVGHKHDEYIPRELLSSQKRNRDSVAYISGDGVMEIGRYVDFHIDDNDTNDFACRLYANGYGDLRTYGNFEAEKLRTKDIRLEACSESQSYLKTYKNILGLCGKQKATINANAFNDSVNDVHYNKELGASQIIVDSNMYPRFRWSNKGTDSYGVAQWSPYYDILTSYEGQNVVMIRGGVRDGDNWNNFDKSGCYDVACQGGSHNQPPNSYYYGTLVVFRTSGSLSQIYMPHSNSHMMQYRTYWYGNNWTNWANVGWSQRETSALEEVQCDVRAYEDRIKTLERRIEALESILKQMGGD